MLPAYSFLYSFMLKCSSYTYRELYATIKIVPSRRFSYGASYALHTSSHAKNCFIFIYDYLNNSLYCCYIARCTANHIFCSCYAFFCFVTGKNGTTNHIVCKTGQSRIAIICIRLARPTFIHILCMYMYICAHMGDRDDKKCCHSLKACILGREMRLSTTQSHSDFIFCTSQVQQTIHEL